MEKKGGEDKERWKNQDQQLFSVNFCNEANGIWLRAIWGKKILNYLFVKHKILINFYFLGYLLEQGHNNLTIKKNLIN